MVCTRVPGSRPDRRRQKVWRVGATYAGVIALMDHLRCEGIQRLVLESTSDYWRSQVRTAGCTATEADSQWQA
jgi:transposase